MNNTLKIVIALATLAAAVVGTSMWVSTWR
jgi:hypothetical protein